MSIAISWTKKTWQIIHSNVNDVKSSSCHDRKWNRENKIQLNKHQNKLNVTIKDRETIKINKCQ